MLRGGLGQGTKEASAMLTQFLTKRQNRSEDKEQMAERVSILRAWEGPG